MADVNPIEVQKVLKGVDYPASKRDLVRHAEAHGAGRDVLDALEAIPDKKFETPAEVNEEIGNRS